jgi:hypothetical protein
MQENMHEGLVLTPAEWAVVRENLDGAIVGLQQAQKAAEANDFQSFTKGWEQAEFNKQTIVSMIGTKAAQIAMRQFLEGT